MGAFFGSYLKKKGEARAAREEFDELLRQLAAQTKATEDVKAAVQDSLQCRVESLRDSLERDRQFSAFSRERIGQHLDRILSSLSAVQLLSDLVAKRPCVYSTELLQAERAMYSDLRSIRVNVEVLLALRAIPQPTHDNVLGAWGTPWWAWRKLVDELTRLNADFRMKFPGEPEFSESRYRKLGEELSVEITKLSQAVLDLQPTVMAPK